MLTKDFLPSSNGLMLQLYDGGVLPYGQVISNYFLKACWDIPALCHEVVGGD